jgi:hypothetical protein
MSGLALNADMQVTGRFRQRRAINGRQPEKLQSYERGRSILKIRP